jgi:hypothetical protein
MLVKSILKNLKGKKIDVYVKNLGQYGLFQGVLQEITEGIIALKSRYNKISYIPISEIIIVTEHEVKTKFLKDKLRDVVMVNSTPQH